MSNQSPNLPRTNSGGELQAIQPLRVLDNNILNAGAAAVTTSSALKTTAVYIYLEKPCHVRFSKTGEYATELDPPLDAGGQVLACSVGERVSVLGLDGGDGRVWICEVKS
ncbi:hypothetical protein JS84_20530 [Vibrio vulnificus]|uniref:hypothetical protein n=1 Tax=Vibrio vulnificus TaxID=672 RepID=UPI000369AD35|nr:hypothetical protein [Vibrio vulnificus]EWS67499.1 hypothetical protein Y702_20440 [Vibrio vulnificus BAA87]KFK59465.1 hypothetical protein JS83_13140 [Vibrio vulnificus]KFK62691.1 hypothetical protein JS84_20530 [Vibrio vulnificus]KFK67875.1 hypothetical protein JS85_17630 [Vibrio vulnificus]NHE85696.1 hypothetical protein [Vibrio vulnificus]